MTHGPAGDSSSGVDYEESEHSGRVVRIASVAALGGLLFGYDSAVINGAVAAIEDEFGIGGFKLGFAVASALLGAAAGALAAGRLADKIGRIAVMKIAALLFLISAIGAGFSYNFVGTNDDHYLGLPRRLDAGGLPGHRRHRCRRRLGHRARCTSRRPRRRASAGGSGHCSSWRS